MCEITKENYDLFINEINSRINSEVYVTIYNLITRETRVPITSYNLLAQKSWAVIKDNMELDNTIFIDDKWYSIVEGPFYKEYKHLEYDINISISNHLIEYVDRLLNTAIYTATKPGRVSNIAMDLLAAVDDSTADIGFISVDIRS